MKTTSFSRGCWPILLWAIGGALLPFVFLALMAYQGVELAQSQYNFRNVFGLPRALNPIAVEPWRVFSHPPPRSAAYAALLEASCEVCARGGANVVLARGDGINNATLPRVRPWSLHSGSYHVDPALPFCATPNQLLQSLKLGQRRRFPARPEDENATYFAPYGCNYRWFTAAEACEISSRYASITILGDSLSRHHTQGMFMILSNDLIYGALPRLSPQRELYSNCTCDGQFSEHQVCRRYSGNMFRMSNPPAYGICSTHPDFAFKYLKDLRSDSDLDYLCSPDPRPRLLLFQGGAHFHSNANETIAGVIEPTMEALNRSLGACAHEFKVNVAWSGLNSQATFLDEKYPHQSDARAVVFNEATSRFARASYGVEALDFVNLTRNASASDGYHYLSEVNLLKGMFLFNLMHLWSRPAVAGT